MTKLEQLSLPSTVLFSVLLACVIGGLCILCYVAARALFDRVRERQAERLQRDAWLAVQAVTHRRAMEASKP